MSSNKVENKTEGLNYQNDAKVLSKTELDNKKKSLWIKLADDEDKDDSPSLYDNTFNLIKQLRQKNDYDTSKLILQVKIDLLTKLFRDFDSTSLSKSQFCKQIGFVDFVPKKLLKICPELDWIFDYYIYNEAELEDFINCIKIPKITDNSTLEEIIKKC